MWKRRNNTLIVFVVGIILAALLPAIAKEPPKPEHFSHETFDSLLQENVRAGLIRYEGFDAPAFDEYCVRLAMAAPAAWSADERLAFWLNAYNAMTIKAVHKRPGMKMANNFSGFFTADTFVVAGQKLTLQTLRDSILRRFGTPLVHIGAMLPAIGAPRFSSRAFRAANVVVVLDKLAKQYFRTESGCVLDIAAKTIRLSWICKEFRLDFEQKRSGLLAGILPYVDDQTAAFAAAYKNDIIIDFLPFDWRINSRRDISSATAIKPYDTPKEAAEKKSATPKSRK